MHRLFLVPAVLAGILALGCADKETLTDPTGPTPTPGAPSLKATAGGQQEATGSAFITSSKPVAPRSTSRLAPFATVTAASAVSSNFSPSSWAACGNSLDGCVMANRSGTTSDPLAFMGFNVERCQADFGCTDVASGFGPIPPDDLTNGVQRLKLTTTRAPTRILPAPAGSSAWNGKRSRDLSCGKAAPANSGWRDSFNNFMERARVRPPGPLAVWSGSRLPPLRWVQRWE